MKILLLLVVIPSILGDDSLEEMRQNIRARLLGLAGREPMTITRVVPSEGSRKTDITVSSFPLGPFGMMTGFMSSARSALENSEERDDSFERKLEGQMDDIKEEMIKGVKKAQEKISSEADEEDDDPLKSFGTFTDVLGSIFGKLVTTIGSKMEADPMDRKSPFGIADVIGNTFTQLKGPHICIREVNTVLDTGNKTRVYKQECLNFAQAVKCSTTRINENEARVTTRIQECCDGFTTTNIRSKGCNKEIKTQSTEELFNEYNVTKKSEKVPKESTLIISKGNSEEVIMFPESLNDYDMSNGILTSTDNKKYIVAVSPCQSGNPVTIRLNCVRLSPTNIPLKTGKAHIASRNIRPAASSVIELLRNDGRFKKFLSILSDETIADLSNSSASYTVLPFTDESYENFPKTFRDRINKRIPCFTSGIVKSHIFQPLTCSDSLKLTKAKIIESDLVTVNGVIHIVDDIMAKDNLESWNEHLKQLAPKMEAGLEKSLNEQDPSQSLTFFVPINLIDKEDDNVEGSGVESEEYLTYVLPWYLPSLKALPPSLTTMGNTTIFAGSFKPSTPLFTFSRSTKNHSYQGAQIGCSRFLLNPRTKAENEQACGASFFFLEQPIPKVTHTIKTFLASRAELSRFNELLSSYLKNNGTLPRVSTIFAPVDDAFSVNNIKRLKSSKERTASFVKRHLVAQPICEHDFHTAGIRLERMSNRNGDHLKYAKEEGENMVEDSRVMESFVVSDGVVHIVDSIIVNREKTEPSSSLLSRFSSTRM